ncbi:MAG: hypothetical protein JJ909_11265 [Roseivirga sp.]|nr:hypothetical protein [Roseivirga sp.]
MLAATIMNETKKQEIANSFPNQFETSKLCIEISTSEFEIFKEGIYAGSMDEKWNVFVLDDIIYFARSWTNNCIYKVLTSPKGELISLSDFHVNRDEKEYKSKDLEYDTVLLKKLLQMFLNREDLYSDPKLELPLIKKLIEKIDPKNNCKKSIGSNNVGLTRQIHDGLTTDEQKNYFDVIGWDQLKEIIADKDENEPLISLYIQHRENKSAVTYYFDNEVDKLLGEIRIKSKISSS